jgi:hypothetical protein
MKCSADGRHPGHSQWAATDWKRGLPKAAITSAVLLEGAWRNEHRILSVYPHGGTGGDAFMKWEHQVKFLGKQANARLRELLEIEGQEGWELGALLRDDHGFLGVFRAIDKMVH